MSDVTGMVGMTGKENDKDDMVARNGVWKG